MNNQSNEGNFYNGQLIYVYWGDNQENPQLANFKNYVHDEEDNELHCIVRTAFHKKEYKVPVSIVSAEIPERKDRVRRKPSYYVNESQKKLND